MVLGLLRLELAEVVAEPVGGRLEDGEGLHIRLFLGRIRAPGCEGNAGVVPGVLRRLLHGRASAEHDQVGQGDLLPAGLRAVELALDPLQGPQHLRQLGGVVDLQSFWGARRRRAPLAPPRLSVPRCVDAEAQAAETSWEIVSPEARIVPLSAAMSCAPISSWVTGGTGSCQICGSAGTSGPRYRLTGPMSRWVSLNHALAKASASSCGFS